MMDRVSPPFFVVPWPGLVGPAFGRVKIRALGLLAVGGVYRIIGTAGLPLGSPPIREYPGPPSAKGVIIPPARLKRSSQYAPWSRSAVKIFCPAGHGETPGQQVLLGRSASLVPWLLPKEVHRFDLGSPPNRQSWRLLPCRLPHRAAGQKTARILDMNGGEPLFFKVLKGESIFPFNIWKRQRVFVGVSLKNFCRIFESTLKGNHYLDKRQTL